MKFFENLKVFRFEGLQYNLFRREAEKYYYAGKSYVLPEIFTDKLLSDVEDKLTKYINTQPISSTDIFSADALHQLLSGADSLLQNKYKLYDTEFHAGKEFQWNYDYVNKVSLPTGIPWKEEFDNLPASAEFAFLLVPGRLFHGPLLGYAYRLTGEVKYYQEWQNILNSFLTQNPFFSGLHWKFPGESAMRAINVILSLLHFREAHDFRNTLLNPSLRLLLATSLYLENSLSEEKKTNHLFLINVCALCLIGVLFSGHEYGQRIKTTALKLLKIKLQKQFTRDGIHVSHSMPGQLLILEALLITLFFIKRTEKNQSDLLSQNVMRIADAVRAFSLSDGRIPEIGHSIISQILPSSPDTTVIRSSTVLSFASRVLMNFSYSSGNHYADMICNLYFPDTDKRISGSPITAEKKSFGFKEGGLFLLQNSHLKIIFKSSEIRSSQFSAPAHNDIFSFELYKNELPVILDAGTYSFYKQKDLYAKLRSVVSHNTFTVDGIEPVESFSDSRGGKDYTKPKILEWYSGPDEDIVSAQHYAYVRLADPVICKRSIKLLKEESLIRIKDEFFGGGTHTISSRLLFPGSVNIIKESATVFFITGNSFTFRLEIKSSTEKFDSAISETQYSPSYSVLADASRLTFQFAEKLPAFYVMEFSLI